MLTKWELFLEGWNRHAAGLEMPDAVKFRDEKEIVSWEDRLKPLTIFQCREFGEKQGKAYFDAVNGDSNGLAPE